MNRTMRLAGLVIVTLALVFTAEPLAAQAQGEALQWRFGAYAGLAFPASGGSSPQVVVNSPMYTSGGSASISDPRTGQIVLFTDGSRIWNRRNQVMVNGDTLGGCPVLSGCSSPIQSVLTLRTPGSNRQYVVFSSRLDDARSDIGRPRDTNYSATYVDIDANGGNGVVTARNVELWPTATRQLTAIRMCNKDGYWIIGHERTGDRFIIWPFDSQGIGVPHTQNAGFFHLSRNNREGYIKASLDGRLLAVAAGLDDQHVQVFGFDRFAGRLAEPAPLRIWIGPSGAYGVSFSPSGRFLYVTDGGHSRISQFDLTTFDSVAVARSQQVIGTAGAEVGALQLAPDGRIYCAVLFENTLAVIKRPDYPGTECEFDRAGVSLGSRAGTWYDLPNIAESDLGLRPISTRDYSICAGDSVKLESRWLAKPLWSPTRGLSCSTCSDPIAAPGESTTYYLSDGLSPACGPIDSVRVVVRLAPQVTMTGDTEVCAGASTKILVRGGAKVRWMPSEDLSCLDCSDVVITPRKSTTYYFEVQSADGCAVSDSVFVRVHPIPTPSAGPDVTVCSGDTARLRAEGGATYRWSPQNGLSCVDCAEPFAAPATSTRYRVDVVDTAGCTAYDEVYVTVLERVEISAGDDTSICAGATVRLVATGATTVQWDPSPDLSCFDCASPVARPTGTTTYYVTGKTDGRCQGRDSVTVVVAPLPALSLAGDSAVCAGGSAGIVASGAERYRWSTPSGPLSCPTCAEQRVVPGSTTTYYVTGYLGECSSVDSFTVRVVDRPDVMIAGGGELCRGERMQLTATGATTYRWAPADGLSCTECSAPVASPRATTTYTVIGSLSGGCADTAFVTIGVVEPRRIRAYIERGVRVLPGETRVLHVSLDQSMLTDSLRFSLSWNRTVAALTGIRPTSIMEVDGWTVEPTVETGGRFEGLLRRSTPASIGPGEILEMDVRAFLGDTTATEMELKVDAPAVTCVLLEAANGQFQIDSICGLNVRLIEMSDAQLLLASPVPNPSVGRTEVRYSVPFETVGELLLVDPRGGVHCVECGIMAAGDHSVEVATSMLASGIYELRLAVGQASRHTTLVVIN